MSINIAKPSTGERIAHLYRAGTSLAQLADRFGLSVADTIATLNRQGVAVVEELWWRDRVYERTQPTNFHGRKPRRRRNAERFAA